MSDNNHSYIIEFGSNEHLYRAIRLVVYRMGPLSQSLILGENSKNAHQ
jgi:hypothetical protein